MLKPARQSVPLDLGNFEYVRRYQRIYELDILPLGLFGRLIARFQEWETDAVAEMWLTGIVLKVRVSFFISFGSLEKRVCLFLLYFSDSFVSRFVFHFVFLFSF